MYLQPQYRCLFSPAAAFGLLILFLTSALPAQVPQLLNYQGRVAVAGANFDGSGSFKFALVNASGSVTYWSNDGSSTNGSQPVAAVALPVSKGLYSVLLGDTAVPGMAALPATVFSNPDVWLRVWFNDGTNGSQLLSPDQRIAAVGYAMVAASANAVADGAITSAKIAPGAVGAAQLGTGAAAANLNASGQSGVASGGVVLSQTETNPALASAGYVKVGTVQTGDVWLPRALSSITGRSNHTAVWTGSEMIVWGGTNGTTSLNDGVRYTPATNSWKPVSASGAPTARGYHTAVWTGSEMIVWGGQNGSTYLNDGGRYNPSTDRWTTVNTTGAPVARRYHTAVWAGNTMIVWGGSNGSSLNDGSLYSTVKNTWTPVSSTGAPSVRYSHSAVWTGSEMIIWGGSAASNSPLGDGRRYNPTGNSWTTMTTTGQPEGRTLHTAVWSGSEMIVWGGNSVYIVASPIGTIGGGSILNSGGLYNPVTDAWKSTNLIAAPSLRYSHTAVWTGNEMLVWGGKVSVTSVNTLNDGGRYTPQTDNWTPITISGAPSARYSHVSVWTGNEMVISGGLAGNSSVYFNDTFSYNLGKVLFLYQKP